METNRNQINKYSIFFLILLVLIILLYSSEYLFKPYVIYYFIVRLLLLSLLLCSIIKLFSINDKKIIILSFISITIFTYYTKPYFLLSSISRDKKYSIYIVDDGFGGVDTILIEKKYKNIYKKSNPIFLGVIPKFDTISNENIKIRGYNKYYINNNYFFEFTIHNFEKTNLLYKDSIPNSP